MSVPFEPNFIYGTAWKEDLTESCVIFALRAGFRAIDTANQRQHYFEEGAGRGLHQGLRELGLRREDVFLQTKFTYARGQDHRKPYDESATFAAQVEQSFASSLEHLQTDYIDSYVLHGPSTGNGLTAADWETWGKMEEICRSGKIKALGVSNVNFDQLVELFNRAKIKPKFVQNRCFAEMGWDKRIREFCAEQGIVYQGFSLLTANWKFLGGNVTRPSGRNVPQLEFTSEFPAEIQEIVDHTGKSIDQIVFRFSQQVGMTPITGTRDPKHMKTDLAIDDFSLNEEELRTLENIAFINR